MADGRSHAIRLDIKAGQLNFSASTPDDGEALELWRSWAPNLETAGADLRSCALFVEPTPLPPLEQIPVIHVAPERAAPEAVVAAVAASAGLPAHPGRQISGAPLLLPGRRSADQLCQRSSATIWIRLPQVSFSMAMVEPVTLVGGMVNSAPSGFMRSYSRCTSST